MVTAQDFVLKLKLELCVKRVHPRPSLVWILAFISIYARKRLVLVYLMFCFHTRLDFL